MPGPAVSIDRVLDETLPRDCGECGSRLPQPGEQCGACAAFPPTTRAEAHELLSRPGAMGQLYAEKLREEAAADQLRAEAKLREADRFLLHGRLEAIRDMVQGKLEAAVGQRKQADAALRQAKAALAETVTPLTEARELHRQAVIAEEGARRNRLGPAAEVDTKLRLDAAGPVLARYEQAHAAAQAAVDDAQAALAAAEDRVADTELARDQAAGVLAADLVNVPLSAETIKILFARGSFHATQLYLDHMSQAPARGDEYWLVASMAETLAGTMGVLTHAEKKAFEKGRRSAQEDYLRPGMPAAQLHAH